MIKKILKYMVIGIISIITIIVIVGVVFVNTSPEFGGKYSEKDEERYEKSGHFKDGVFVNQIETSMDMSFSSIVSTSIDFIKGVKNGRPDKSLTSLALDSTQVADNRMPRLIWFGHSAFLLQTEGKNILIDPMLGEVPAPHPLLGGKRYQKELPLQIEKLPQIDLIIISHDHYDHLDYGSIQKLKAKTKLFFVPLGVGAHFKAWGVPDNQIVEFNWWDEKEMEGINFAFTPSRHFSGRGLSDRSKTLWGSWVIKTKEKNIFFSGDSGYGEHFKEIGEKFGPFDFAMMECRQYNEKWHDIHMMPEETAQASIDIKTKLMMPIHWGSFTLALHSWTDPVERVSKKLEEFNQDFIIPRVGESIWLEKPSVSNSFWWKK